MKKKLDKMADIDILLASIREMIDESLFDGIETTDYADHLQKTAQELAEEALAAYKNAIDERGSK